MEVKFFWRISSTAQLAAAAMEEEGGAEVEEEDARLLIAEGEATIQ